MHNPTADLHKPILVRANPQKRIIALGIVGAIHIAAIYAVVTGLVPGITHTVPGTTIVVPPVDPVPPKNTETIKEKDLEKTFVDPKDVTAIEPDIKIARDAGLIAPVYGDLKPPANPPTAVSGIMSTHTIPAYPAMALRLSQQGTVTLRLIVAGDGSVNDARVETSSGSSYLDDAAIAWVKLHWRYKPATEKGVAVASVTMAAIRFDLKNAR